MDWLEKQQNSYKVEFGEDPDWSDPPQVLHSVEDWDQIPAVTTKTSDESKSLVPPLLESASAPLGRIPQPQPTNSAVACSTPNVSPTKVSPPTCALSPLMELADKATESMVVSTQVGFVMDASSSSSKVLNASSNSKLKTSQNRAGRKCQSSSFLLTSESPVRRSPRLAHLNPTRKRKALF